MMLTSCRDHTVQMAHMEDLLTSLNHFAASHGHGSVESVLARHGSGSSQAAAARKQFRAPVFQPRLYWLDRD